MQQEQLDQTPAQPSEARQMDIEDQMTEFEDKIREYRQLSQIKSKIRKIPARTLNRRHKKLQEVVER